MKALPRTYSQWIVELDMEVDMVRRDVYLARSDAYKYIEERFLLNPQINAVEQQQEAPPNALRATYHPSLGACSQFTLPPLASRLTASKGSGSDSGSATATRSTNSSPTLLSTLLI